MKKLLFLMCALFIANVAIIAQNNVTLRVDEVDVTTLGVGDQVLVPVYMDQVDGVVMGWEFYILFDPAYLTPVYTTGTVPQLLNKFAGFPGSWFENIVGGNQFAANWLDATFTGVVVPPGQMLFQLVFTYNGGLLAGGESLLTWNFSKSVSSDFQVKGVTAVVNGSFAFYNVIPDNGRIYVAGGPVGKVWTGLGGDLDWFNDGNWAPPGEPGATDDVTINATKAPLVVISGGSAVCAALTVALGAGIQIDPQADLTTNGLFTNNGYFVIKSESLNGWSGSYIPNAGHAGAGVFEFDRNTVVWGDAVPEGDWHYISSPMQHTGAQGPPVGVAPNTWDLGGQPFGFDNWDFFDFYMNEWDEDGFYGIPGNWHHIVGNLQIPCDRAPFTPITELDAYAINWETNYLPLCQVQNVGTLPDYGFQRVLGDPAAAVITDIEMIVQPSSLMQDGPYGALATFTPAAGINAGWNLFGNPYPSALDVAALSAGNLANGMVDGAAMWDPVNDNYEYSNAGNFYQWPSIAPTTGFFVQYLPGGGNFATNNGMRVHDAGVWFWKSEVSDLLVLQASITGDNRFDKLYVRFGLENTTPGFDQFGDFRKLFAGGAQIYTIAGDEKLAVNALPATETVPMGFTAETSGMYTIEAIETSEFANVVLEDLSNGVQTDLLTGSYTFEYTSGAEHGFVIHFTPLGTPELEANSINIWAADHNVYVQAPATTGDIVVYNMMGQEVVRTDIEAGLNVIPMKDVNTYYIVKVIGSDITETGKVFIK